jgi:hypothetical protein
VRFVTFVVFVKERRRRGRFYRAAGKCARRDRRMYHRPVLVTIALFPLLLLSLSQPTQCADAGACRQAAVEAAGRGDFETFHDLAWRAAQKGRPNDPELMYLLARAQSLSGRPGDALVMLRRLAQMGVRTDAPDNADFERVRRLPGWPELEALLAGSSSTAPPLSAPSAPPPAPPPPPAPVAAATAPAGPKAKSAPAATPSYSAAPAGRRGAENAMRLTTTTVNPVGLAYDSASRRFVVGDGDGNKLMVADEVFDHVNDLIGPASAGFARLSAVEIDTRRGDLWVTSSDGNGAASIHKLQLVSGRVLSQIAVPSELQPMVISDFAVIDDGTLVLVDSREARLLRVKTTAGRFQRPLALHVSTPLSVAPANGVTYVAHADGVSVVDTASGRVTGIQPAKGLSLSMLRRIRWSRGGLVAIQGEGTGSRLVRIRLSANGRRATAVEPLDGDVQSVGTALTISRDAAYYVASTPEGATIRRVEIR